MIYDIHRFDINMEKDQDKLKQYLNTLRGEVVAIIPNVKPTFKPMGAIAKVDFLLIAVLRKVAIKEVKIVQFEDKW